MNEASQWVIAAKVYPRVVYVGHYNEGLFASYMINNITDLGCFLRSYLTHLLGDRCNPLLDLEMCFFGVNIEFKGRQIRA